MSAPLSRENMDSIGYILELARKTGFKLQISPLYGTFWGNRDGDSPEQLDRQELVEIINRIISYKKRGYPVFYYYKTYSNILNWPDFTMDRITGREPDFPHPRCYMGRYVCTIDANGDVYPCAQLGGFKVKNCLEVGFNEAFRNISGHDCRACFWACYNEYNLLFALNPGVIANTVRNIFSNQ
jgi:MoaA/NifB/PqqE/SkfB family radical SAM enzyme